jgi:CRP/FNR family transcriptional regulator
MTDRLLFQHTHEQLATETASGRAFVSRRLAEFARAGLVAPGRGWIDLSDVRGLERIAADTR